MEKNKYMRERLFYQREQQIVLYEEANRKYHECDTEVKDNLIKTAKTICQPDDEEFKRQLESRQIDYQDLVTDIKEHISEIQAQNYANHWTNIRNQHNDFLADLRKKKAEQDAG